MKLTEINENGLKLVFGLEDSGEIKLLHFSALPFDETKLGNTERYRVAEIMISGEDRPLERHGNKYVSTSPGYRMKLREFRDKRNEMGRKLEIVMFDDISGIESTSHLQFYDGTRVIRSWTELRNCGTEAQGLEYVSSFSLTGIEKEGLLPPDDKMKLHIPHNSWMREMQWQCCSFPELGLASCQKPGTERSSNVIAVTNTGNWSTKEYLPMGILENTETGSSLFWQIEHNGSWHWEISDQTGHFYLLLSGPTETESHWWKELKPGESFATVPTAVGSVYGGFDESAAELTKYRRKIRRKNRDNETLPIIFNDYMNCLFGDPTTEKELPLIEAAKKACCEYYCIDAGWYADGHWWDSVGEWKPSLKRFPEGFAKLTELIRNKGMIPGAWLEIEVMGTKCPKAAETKPEWFFIRHGKKVHDRSRWQLDFRNPEVIAHANEVVDRLVNEYHIGYIKMDYNIEPGIGTEINADSVGDGLLAHERAYLSWLDDVFERYPELVIENCSSGGMRIDYAMLARHSIQSTSDQENYLNYATIAANAPAALTPEQSAIWSYPMENGGYEDTVFNMVNAMLMRIHQSGHLANISPEDFAAVKEGLDYYKSIRNGIRNALPFWPLGMSKFTDGWISMGLRTEKKSYLAVWRRNSAEDSCLLPIKHLKGINAKVKCSYPPQSEGTECEFSAGSGVLSVKLPSPVSARIFELETE